MTNGFIVDHAESTRTSREAGSVDDAEQKMG
jgi:hypothetical protein